MSQLQSLIEDLCPAGIEYATLDSLGSFYSGLSGKSKEDFKDGNAPFITYMNVFSNPSLNLDVTDRVKIADGEKQYHSENPVQNKSSEKTDRTVESDLYRQDSSSLKRSIRKSVRRTWM